LRVKRVDAYRLALVLAEHDVSGEIVRIVRIRGGC
jgi:hypothetical protein